MPAYPSVLIDPTNYPSQNPTRNGFVTIDPNTLYVWGNAAASQFGFPTDQAFGVYKSTNRGTSWTRFADAFGLGNDQRAAGAQGTTKLTISDLNGGNTTFFDFTFGPDTFGAGYGTAGGLGLNAQVFEILFLSNGHMVVIYVRFVAAVATLMWAEWNGAAWVSVDNVVAAPVSFGQVANAAFVDSGDRIHILYSITTAGNVFYKQLAGGVLSSATLVYSAGVNTLQAGGVESGGSIFFAMSDQATKNALIVVGTPSATPVFSVNTVDATKGVFNVSDVSAKTGVLSYYWASVHQVYLSTSSDLGATWSPAALVFDADIDPLTIPAGDALSFHSIQNIFATPACFGILIELLMSTSGNYTTYFLQQPACGSPPTIACPVNNQAIIGVAFTSTVIASGTAPLSYSIVGGSLPPGLTLNASTGVISGIPTVRGVFSYTVQVTDGNGLTAQATCPLTVSNFQQVIFQGVRRQKGSLPPLIDKSCYHPKSFIITASAIINTLGDLPVVYPPVTLIQPIYDYPFEWHDLELTYSSAGTLPGRVCALFLYDAVKNQLSNLPVMDIYYNGAPESQLKNGALVPPLIYPAQGEIQVDLFSLIKDPLVLPVTVNLHFVGYRLFPK